MSKPVTSISSYNDRRVVLPTSAFKPKNVARAHNNRSAVYPISAFAKKNPSKPLSTSRITSLPSGTKNPTPPASRSPHTKSPETLPNLPISPQPTPPPASPQELTSTPFSSVPSSTQPTQSQTSTEHETSGFMFLLFTEGLNALITRAEAANLPNIPMPTRPSSPEPDTALTGDSTSPRASVDQESSSLDISIFHAPTQPAFLGEEFTTGLKKKCEEMLDGIYNSVQNSTSSSQSSSSESTCSVAPLQPLSTASIGSPSMQPPESLITQNTTSHAYSFSNSSSSHASAPTQKKSRHSQSRSTEETRDFPRPAEETRDFLKWVYKNRFNPPGATSQPTAARNPRSALQPQPRPMPRRAATPPPRWNVNAFWSF